jgi:hypothetical protein
MLKLRWYFTWLAVVSLVMLFSFGDASASSDPIPPVI